MNKFRHNIKISKIKSISWKNLKLKFSFNPFSWNFLSWINNHFAKSMLFSILKGSLMNSASLVGHYSFSIYLITVKISFINWSVLKNHFSKSLFLMFWKLTLIDFSRWLVKYSLSMKKIVFKGSDVKMLVFI